MVRVSTVQPRGVPITPKWDSVDDIYKEIGEEYPKRAAEQVDHTAGLLEEAGRQGAQIVCTPENANAVIMDWAVTIGKKRFKESVLERLLGYALDRFGRVAREYKMYIVTCMFEAEGETVYNTGWLLGRDGQIRGKYRKVHIPGSEKWYSAAGNEFPVFETEFGNIGILICYDMMFPEAARILCLNGADILFNPTVGFSFRGESAGEVRVRARALDNNVYVVASNYAGAVKDRLARSMIVDCDGYIVADAQNELDAVLVKDIEPQKEVIVLRPDVDADPSGIADNRVRSLVDRRPEIYTVLVDKCPPVLSRYGDIRYRSAGDVWKEKEESFQSRRRID